MDSTYARWLGDLPPSFSDDSLIARLLKTATKVDQTDAARIAGVKQGHSGPDQKARGGALARQDDVAGAAVVEARVHQVFE